VKQKLIAKQKPKNEIQVIAKIERMVKFTSDNDIRNSNGKLTTKGSFKKQYYEKPCEKKARKLRESIIRCKKENKLKKEIL